MPDISQGLMALVAAASGGASLKFIEHWLSKSKVKDDSARQFREDLRSELTTAREDARKIREEMRFVEAELDKWRDKYYALMDQFVKIRHDLDAITGKSEEPTNQDIENW